MTAWSWCLTWRPEIGCHRVLSTRRLIGHLLFCRHPGSRRTGHSIGCRPGRFCPSHSLTYFFDISLLRFGTTPEKYTTMKMLFYLSHYYIDMFLSLHSKCMNMYISFIYCIAASMHECCLVSHWIKFWYEINKKTHIYGISLRILASKDAISYLQF